MKPIAELSLGLRTHLIFARFDAEVVERPDCLVIRTPRNPNFWWGNCLIFDHPPRPGDAAVWLARFNDEIVQHHPGTRHVALGVDSDQPFGLPADFVDAGFQLGSSSTLTLAAEQLRSPRTPLADGYRFETIDLATRAAEAVELQVAADELRHPPADEFQLFRERQMQRYATMVRTGSGQWFGVTARTASGDVLVADCGLFRDALGPGGLGRFQFVSTHPAWRRRGLCGALIHAVSRHGFEVMQLATLVICADPDDVAIRIYESIGFQRGASCWQIERAPLAD